MSNNANGPVRFSISVDGTQLAPEVVGNLIEAVIEDDLAQPAMFTLCFHDPELKLTDGTQFKPGGEVTIAGANPGGQRTTILVGEVTALEPVLDQHFKRLVVRGYDRAHRLYRGHKTRTFLKQTDSNIASRIAQEAGLTADVEATSEQHEYVMQDNQTDMEFLRGRAARVGFRVIVENRKLKFRRPEGSPPEAPVQEWSKTLLSFRARMTAVAQANEVQVRGWNPKTKQAIVGRASTAAQPSIVGDGKNGGQVAQQSFGSAATVMVTDQPVSTQSEANKLAQAVLDDLTGDYLSAEGVCLGEPAIKAGKLVEVKGIGTRLSGKYFVTASRHEYTPENGYTTTFTVNGHRPYSLLAGIDGKNGHHGVAGVVIAIVTNNNDPDKLGRVKVKYPWLDEQQESDWARLASPGAGLNRGLILVPEVNDEVLVAFEHGDINRPFVVGGLWNGRDKPPPPVIASGKVKSRMLTTRVGHTIEFEDGEGAQKGFILLKTAGGHIVKISDSDKKIEIKSQRHSVTLDDQAQAVTIESGKDIQIKGPGGKLAITPQGVELTANANIKLQANAQLQIQANAMLDVKSSGILNIQGSLVKIN